ncbi:MAG: hypothetical protein NZ821_07660 [Gloeomargarita sp. SKYB31]|nr:hypothetical protein [Gloeomargarita sp. SKYB31]
MDGKLIVPAIVIRPLMPPPPRMGARYQPHYLYWQVGRYKERLVSGPAGLGRGRIWVPELEGEQHNLVLNQTYDSLIAQHGFIAMNRVAVVGTGSTPPSPTQTGLVNEVGRTIEDQTGNTSGTRTITRVSDGVYEIAVVREFTEAQVGNRNLTEWGFSPSTSAGGNLSTRELFRDGNGDPIVITPASDQRLRLIYKTRLTITPTTPQNVSIDISGLGVFTGQFTLNRATHPDYGTDVWYTDMADLGFVDMFSYGKVNVRVGQADLPIIHHPIVATFTPNYTTFRSWYSFGTSGEGFIPSFWEIQDYVPNSRQRKSAITIFPTARFNDTWRGIAVWTPAGASEWGATAQFVWSSSFTKTDIYKVVINEWTLTWGP